MGLDGNGKLGCSAPPIPVPPPIDDVSLARDEQFNPALDIRIDEAVARLSDKLAPEQVSFIRSALRSLLTTDPCLVHLLRHSTKRER